MKQLLLIGFATILLLSACTSTDPNFEEKVKKSVEWQMHLYPELELQDLYKSFFQDKFGPGHIIEDSTAARKYLVSEILNSNSICPFLEKTGWESNFYRVNLLVLKDNIMPIDSFFNAFLESTKNVKAPSVKAWYKEWNQIVTIIRSMELNLPDFEQQAAEIEKMLANGNYIMHHSQHFIDTYVPHYRLISKEVYDKRLAKYLPAVEPKEVPQTEFDPEKHTITDSVLRLKATEPERLIIPDSGRNNADPR